MENQPTYEELKRECEELKNRAIDLNRLKDNFVTNISHEIRTPLNAIMGSVELLRSNHLDKEERDEFTSIFIRRCKDLLTIFNNINELSLQQSKVFNYSETEVDIQFLLERLHYNFQNQIKGINKPISLSFDNEVNTLCVYTDPALLNKAISYLLDNAIKFTPKGTINYGCRLKDKTLLEFYVKDTGIGIQKKDLAVILDKFSQAETGDTRSYEGVGLGLTLSKNIIEYLGGQLSIESKVDVGSKFSFTFPFKIAKDKKEQNNRIANLLKNNKQ